MTTTCSRPDFLSSKLQHFAFSGVFNPQTFGKLEIHNKQFLYFFMIM